MKLPKPANLLKNVANKANDVKNTVAGVADKANDVKNTVANTASNVKSTVSNTASNVKGTVTNAVSNAVSNAKSTVNNTANTVKDSLLGTATSRSLTPAELRTVFAVFGNSVDTSKVVITEGDLGVVSKLNPNRAFVVGNTIYVPPRTSLGINTLVHEMVHVWQYQNGGPAYAVKALIAQQTGPVDPQSGNRGYYYNDDVIAEKPFAKLNPEQQAKLITDAFVREVLPPTHPPKAFVLDGVDRTNYVLQAWDMLKSGQGAA